MVNQEIKSGHLLKYCIKALEMWKQRIAGPTLAILEKLDHFNEIHRASSGPLQLIVGLGSPTFTYF